MGKRRSRSCTRPHPSTKRDSGAAWARTMRSCGQHSTVLCCRTTDQDPSDHTRRHRSPRGCDDERRNSLALKACGSLRGSSDWHAGHRVGVRTSAYMSTAQGHALDDHHQEAHDASVRSSRTGTGTMATHRSLPLPASELRVDPVRLRTILRRCSCRGKGVFLECHVDTARIACSLFARGPTTHPCARTLASPRVAPRSFRPSPRVARCSRGRRRHRLLFRRARRTCRHYWGGMRWDVRDASSL